jgi:hypothetical protein
VVTLSRRTERSGSQITSRLATRLRDSLSDSSQFRWAGAAGRENSPVGLTRRLARHSVPRLEKLRAPEARLDGSMCHVSSLRGGGLGDGEGPAVWRGGNGPIPLERRFEGVHPNLSPARSP